jgi:DNA-binding response OmpR family regulator
MYNILIVDDDENIRELLTLYLNNAGFSVVSCGDGTSALKALSSGTFDAALLDVMLPDIKGYELCRRIRETYTLPVLMITARDMLTDKIQGFNSGADDYIVKPFEPIEVIARINARLRGVKKAEPSDGMLSIGDITVDIKTYEVRKGGELVGLKPKEIHLLHFLLLNKNIVFSRETLLEKVWNYDFAGDTRTVDVHVKTLRKKLLDNDSTWDIKTVWGVGYKLEGR